MAKLEVITSTNSVEVTMNEYASAVGFVSGLWNKQNTTFQLKTDHILVHILGERDWKISGIENLEENILKVDSVNGNTTDNLATLWSELITAFG